MKSLSFKKDLMSPSFIFPIFFLFSYLIGHVVNSGITAIPLNFINFYFIGLFFYFLGLNFAKINFFKYKGSIDYRPRKVPYILIMIPLLFVLLVSFYVFYAAGIPMLSSNANVARTEVISDVGGFIYYIYRCISIFIVLLGVRFIMSNQRQTKITLFLILSILLLILMASGYRSFIILPIGALLIYSNYYVRKATIFDFLILSSFAILLLGLFGFIRLSSESLNISNFMSAFISELQVPVYNFYRSIEWGGRLYGWYTFGAFAAILPGSQVAVGAFLKEALNLHYEGGGFAPSLLGGFYLDFGIYGIIVGLFLMGYSIQKIYMRYTNYPSPYRCLTYAVVMCYFIFSVRAGFFQDIFYPFVILLIFLIEKVFEYKKKAL